MTTLYGIPNCDSVKKARKWLDANGLPYTFHDLRGDGVTPAMVERWSAQVGWEQLLNRRSTSWRQLSEQTRNNLNQSSAMKLLVEVPTLIKRPILEQQNGVTVGFRVDEYEILFGQPQ